MAKKYEPPQEAVDSDEDCEVYFLKPVNEYNITERIKEANKELFANSSSIANVETYDDDNDDDGSSCSNIMLEAAMASNRKVTFALNLEDYEPGNDTENGGDGGETMSEMEASALHMKLTRDFKFPAIEEEEAEGENHHNECGNLMASKMGAGINVDDDDELVEEICEEIIVMDMEEQTPKRMLANSMTDERTVTQQRRHIVKQNTFAYEDDEVLNAQQHEEEIEEIAELAPSLLVTELTDESDNKSLTNLLISDCEDDDNCKSSADICKGSGSNTYVTDIVAEEEDDIDDDEDDKLSIIVASYISDDYDCGDDEYSNETASLHTPGVGANQLQKNGARKTSKSRRILPFSKHFSLRRKVNSSSNAIGISNSRCNSANNKHQPPQITDLKLNYKTCCEYRQAGQEKLPKYTGYLSEYGLTAAQLAQRAERMQRKQRHLLEQTLKANEQEMRKMHDNERAFTTWLRNKMRYPINKTRNMFDIKKTNSIFSNSCNVKSGFGIGLMRQRNAAAHNSGSGNCAGIGLGVDVGDSSDGGGGGKQRKK